MNGIAEILESPDHLARFAVAGQPPKSILRITANTVFFQCSRAVIRAGL
ncbi:putative pyridoxine 5'-phosphate oxidase superfamily flavin-nucleotide-binding protein [Sphingomonas aerophila]|uniref:Putative pyridoxine 5'-phosphate oxidase superfamily flavin-nucleotide-binding protein n=1 Tax=Sphingomonas aerophila TaxID=1344948 RepID=A0A7W9BGZ5_9SPHN|nr:putative pyridoxine 5'-phosphate oxidase superfamily flavin-nucleotide-binding protein [Sphingomonas aerophila]